MHNVWSKELMIELMKMLKGASALWDIQAKVNRNRSLKFNETLKICCTLKKKM
jgi:hypothetical protein